jgi:hypothetical protein
VIGCIQPLLYILRLPTEQEKISLQRKHREFRKNTGNFYALAPKFVFRKYCLLFLMGTLMVSKDTDGSVQRKHFTHNTQVNLLCKTGKIQGI